MTVDGKVLPAGKYIIMVAPEWNKSSQLDPEYKKIRVGIFSPIQVNLSKCERRLGHKAIACGFQEIAEDMPESSLSILPGLPEIYKAQCVKAVNQ